MLYIKMLLYEFEKCFYLPSLFIPCGNGIRVFVQYICYKTNRLLTFVYKAFNNSVLILRILFFLADKKSDFIGENSNGTISRFCSNFFRGGNPMPDIEISTANK